MKKTCARIVSGILLVLVSAVSLYPFYTMVIMSTYKTENIFKGIPFFPSDFFAENLKIVMESNFIRPSHYP